MDRVFSFSWPYPNNRNGVYLPPPINSPYKTARCLFIHTKLVNAKWRPLKPPGLSASKWNSLNLEEYGKKNQQILMLKPQGGSLHTDENLSMHEHRVCCLTPGREEEGSACIQDCTRRRERTRSSGVSKLRPELPKLNILPLSPATA